MNLTISYAFQAFSLMHVGILLACGGVIYGFVKFALAAQRNGQERRATVGVAMAALGFWFFQQGYYVLIERDWSNSLPLHVCDLAGVVGPMALLMGRRPLRATLYFWAMGLTIWGLLTPALERGPGHVVFWLYWINHGGVVLMAVYDCVVRGYRPSGRDYATAMLVTLAYLAVVLPMNLANPGWNYGYVGDVQLAAKTPLDWLPDWPWRILGVQALGAVMMAAVWLPWEVAGRRSRGRSV